MRRIKLLVVTDEMEVGGTQRQIAALLTGIDRRRFEPALLYFRSRSPLVDEIAASGVKTIQIAKRSRIDLPFLWRFTSLLQREGFDVIHCFSFTGELWGALAHALAGHGRLISSIRGVYEWYRPAQWRVKSWVSRRSYRVIANSRAGAAYAEEKMGSRASGKIEVIYNGIDAPGELAESQRRALRGTLHIPEETVVGLFVGRLVDHKNLPSLVRAASLLEAAGTRLTILIAGEGPEQAALMTMIREHGCRNIRLLGQRSDIAHLLQTSDFLVLPSFREGLSNAILEAMIAGKPVVASRVGGNVELVQHERTGLLYPGDDHAALARAISSLVASSDLRSRLGSAGRQLALECYSRNEMIRRMESLYLGAFQGLGACGRQSMAA
jgi:glycosyltransferase involved in cell wall biosynthesis